MEVAPRDGGNYIPDVIKYATGVDLVECSIKAAMGEKIEIGEIVPSGFYAYYAVHSLKDGILKNIIIDCPEKVIDNHLLVKPGDRIKAFTGANTTLGCLIMKFDSMEQMLDMMDHSDKWCHLVLEGEE